MTVKAIFCNPFPHPTVLFIGLLGCLSLTKVFLFFLLFGIHKQFFIQITDWWTFAECGYCIQCPCSPSSTGHRQLPVVHPWARLSMLLGSPLH